MVISIAMKMERERSQLSSCVALTRTQSKVFEWILLLNSWMKGKFSFTTAVVPSWCYIPWCHCRQRGPLVWELASHAGGGYSVGSNLGVWGGHIRLLCTFFFCLFLVFLLILFIACVASVSVWFRSEKRPRNDARNKILGFGRARKETSAKKWKRGRGRGRKKVSFLSSSPPPHSFACAILTLVPRSLLLNRTETLATRAIFFPFGLFPSASRGFCDNVFLVYLWIVDVYSRERYACVRILPITTVLGS